MNGVIDVVDNNTDNNVNNLQEGLNLTGVLTGSVTINGFISSSTTVYADYDGDYEIIPSNVVQTLNTRNKITRQNIIVREIPYEEVDNQYGITVNIG